MTYAVPAVPDSARLSPEAQVAYLSEDGFVISPPGLLEDRLRTTPKLRVKFGVDPTAPAVTWGWSVPLRRLRRFQELGHTAVLVIGDFTAQVGDPSGRSATRKRLTSDEVDQYVNSCMASLLEILSPDNLEVRRNSEWLGAMSMADILALTSQATVAQLLERDDFEKRFHAHEPISVIEFMYPLLQSYDSVAVRADIELGGTDQYFNFMLARTIQQRNDQAPQALICAPLLVGTDGKKKMSQSVGNYIGVAEPANEIFGKVLSIPDEAMTDYLTLGTDLRPAEKTALLTELRAMTLKRRIAREMITMFHGAEAAEAAEAEFNRVHVRRDMPEEIPDFKTDEHYLAKVLVVSGLATSLNDARRSIKGGGVKVDGQAIGDEHATLDDGVFVVQIGRRRFVRAHITTAS